MTDKREMRERAEKLLKDFKFVECGSSSNPAHYYIEFGTAFAAAERDMVINDASELADRIFDYVAENKLSSKLKPGIAEIISSYFKE